MMRKPYVALPARTVTVALSLLKKLGLTQYGPEQVNFLRYRPVLSNRKVKAEFGYVPEKTTREVFEFFMDARRRHT
jgi:UDP-glucose 4-epimerase